MSQKLLFYMVQRGIHCNVMYVLYALYTICIWLYLFYAVNLWYRNKSIITQKTYKQELLFSCSAWHLMMLKFHQDIVNGVQVIEQTLLCNRYCYLQIQRGITKTIHKQALWFLHSAHPHLVLNICMKFHEDILKGFYVLERTRVCHRNWYLQSSTGHY